MGVVVDSSVFIQIERDGQVARELLSDFDELCTASIVVSELLTGVHLSLTERQRSGRQQFVDDVLAEFPILGIGVNEAREHARLFVALRRAGTPIGERDLMIAATAMANGHSVLTKNVAEFSQVPGLKVEPV